jgi:glucose/arabinose dehydrogenase
MNRSRRLGRRGVLLASLVALGLAARAATADVQLPNDFVNEVIASSLDSPTSMAFLPDGRVLFIEQKTAKVRMVVNGLMASTDPEFVVPNVNTDGYERGLEGIAVDPGWPTRPYVYFHFTRLGGYIRIVRYTVTGDVANPQGQTLSFGNPLLLIDDITDLNPNHQAGCLRFGPEGDLYASLGEDENWCAAADSTSLKGALIRMDVSRLPASGGPQVPRALLIPPDNPLSTPDSDAMLVWAYGLRNPWRYQIDPITGLIYLADVGEDKVEEINEVAPGDYLGWPWREGNVIVTRSNCPEPGGVGSIAYKPPIVAMSRGTNLTAIVSAGMYRPVAGAPANWPSSYNGDVFYGEYYSGVLHRLKYIGGSWQAPAPDPGQPDPNTWATGMASECDFQVGPDGSLWWLRQYDDATDPVTGSLQRIRYVGQTVDVVPAAQLDPQFSIGPNPSSGPATMSFRMPVAGYVRLEVFDLAGRLTRRLVDGTLLAGPRQIVWDGRDGAGRAVPPGVYMARLERPSGVEAVHLLRLK